MFQMKANREGTAGRVSGPGVCVMVPVHGYLSSDTTHTILYLKALFSLSLFMKKSHLVPGVETRVYPYLCPTLSAGSK